MKKAAFGIANIFSRSCFTGRNLRRVQQNKKQKHVSVKLASANLGLACVE